MSSSQGGRDQFKQEDGEGATAEMAADLGLEKLLSLRVGKRVKALKGHMENRVFSCQFQFTVRDTPWLRTLSQSRSAETSCSNRQQFLLQTQAGEIESCMPTRDFLCSGNSAAQGRLRGRKVTGTLMERERVAQCSCWIGCEGKLSR